MLPAYVIINSDDNKNLTNFFNDDEDDHHDFSISVQCEPLAGEEEEEEAYNYEEINVDVTEMDNVSLHIEDCTDSVPFKASKGAYNLSNINRIQHQLALAQYRMTCEQFT